LYVKPESGEDANQSIAGQIGREGNAWSGRWRAIRKRGSFGMSQVQRGLERETPVTEAAR